jgi:hypothetical protein
MIVALAEIEALQARLDAILAEAGRVDEERRRNSSHSAAKLSAHPDRGCSCSGTKALPRPKDTVP